MTGLWWLSDLWRKLGEVILWFSMIRPKRPWPALWSMDLIEWAPRDLSWCWWPDTDRNDLDVKVMDYHGHGTWLVSVQQPTCFSKIVIWTLPSLAWSQKLNHGPKDLTSQHGCYTDIWNLEPGTWLILLVVSSMLCQLAVSTFLTITLNPVTRVTSTLSLTDTEKPGSDFYPAYAHTFLLCHVYCHQSCNTFCLPVPVSHVNGLQGTTAVLPCDVQSSSGWGDVFLILWFKDNATKPMYRYQIYPNIFQLCSKNVPMSSSYHELK